MVYSGCACDVQREKLLTTYSAKICKTFGHGTRVYDLGVPKRRVRPRTMGTLNAVFCTRNAEERSSSRRHAAVKVRIRSQSAPPRRGWWFQEDKAFCGVQVILSAFVNNAKQAFA